MLQLSRRLAVFLTLWSSAYYATAGKCLYETLGVSKSCSAAELKKAYRKSCLQHHPDKGGSEEAFKEVTRAYDVLSDDSKRKLYDKYGEAAVSRETPQPQHHPGGNNYASPNFFQFHSQGSGGSAGGTPPNFDFSNFNFGGINGEQLFGSATARNSGTEGFNLDISELMRKFNQQQKEASFGKRHPFTANAGQKSYTVACSCSLDELATGATKKMKVQFPTRPQEPSKSRVYTISLQKGWKAGTKVKFNGSKGFPPVAFVIQEKKHSHFIRQGNDLVYRHDLKQAKLVDNDGETLQLKLKLPDGEVWSRSLPKSSSFLRDGQQLSVTGKGMPIKGGPSKGNLIIEFYDSSVANHPKSKQQQTTKAKQKYS